uniref:Ig-like domain-containing protein n=1 Tax=Seriola lalandi dorsalis TaxID=1841481 RepID=A0A3B4XBS7_SERLL
SYSFLLLLTLIWLYDVTQHPAVSWNYQSKSAEMNCSHNKDAGHNQMYWYRQRPGETMTLIVYTVYEQAPDYGQKNQTKYLATKENIESGALTVKSLQLEDSGVYFCAVKNTVTYSDPAYFGQGTKLTVLDPNRKITPPTVKVFQPSSKECRNLKDEKERKKTLLCVARDFYPDHVSIFWQVNAKNVTKGVATDPAARLDDKTYFITSRLRVHAEVWTSPGTNFSSTHRITSQNTMKPTSCSSLYQLSFCQNMDIIIIQGLLRWSVCLLWTAGNYQ